MSVSKELADAVQKVVKHGIVKLETSGEQRVLVEISKPSPVKFRRRPPVILEMHLNEHGGCLMEVVFVDQDFNHPPPAEFHDQQIVEDVFQTIKLGLERLEMTGPGNVKLVVAGIDGISVAVKCPQLNLRYCYEWASEFDSINRGGNRLKQFDGFIIRRHLKCNMGDIDRRLHLNHPNIQVIHEIDVDDEFFYWKVEKFTNTLSDVIKGTIPYDEKIFLQLFPALQYFRENKICHGSIHENNIACIGNVWFYTDVFGTQKSGVPRSGFETMYRCLRRHDEIRNDPNNDVWQTNMMYAIARFKLQTNDFKRHNRFFYPGKRSADQELLKSPDGEKLRRLIILKPNDGSINVLREIIQKEQCTQFSLKNISFKKIHDSQLFKCDIFEKLPKVLKEEFHCNQLYVMNISYDQTYKLNNNSDCVPSFKKRKISDQSSDNSDCVPSFKKRKISDPSSDISDTSSTSFESKFSIKFKKCCLENGKTVAMIHPSLRNRINKIFCEMKIRKFKVTFLTRGDYSVCLITKNSFKKHLTVEISETAQSCNVNHCVGFYTDATSLAHQHERLKLQICVVDWSEIKPSLVIELVKLFVENDLRVVKIKIDEHETSLHKYCEGQELPGSTDKKLYNGDVFCRFYAMNTRYFEKITTFDHPNIEKISDICSNKFFFHFKTPKYGETLFNVVQFENMYCNMNAFSDVLNALEYLRDEKFCHGFIHLKNIAWNGTCFIITDFYRRCTRVNRQSSEYFRSIMKREDNDTMFDVLQLAWMVTKSMFNVTQKENSIKYAKFTEKDKMMSSSPIGKKLLYFLLFAPLYVSSNVHPNFYYHLLREIIESNEKPAPTLNSCQIEHGKIHMENHMGMVDDYLEQMASDMISDFLVANFDP